MRKINRPVRFAGDDEQRRLNRGTHAFVFFGDPDDADINCLACDCKPWHAAADYPCGEEPPRETEVLD